MNDKYFYSFYLSFGNIAVIETESLKDSIKLFLSSFGLKHLFFKKIFFPDSNTIPKEYYYSLEMVIGEDDFLKIIRFSEALRAFCSYHHILLREK